MNDIKIIYKKDSENITNKVHNYIGISGIWALFGKKGEVFECLNVGKCVDVGREILYDVSCLYNLTPDNLPDGDEYINQFAESCGFNLKKGQTQEYLYPHISKHYDTIMFVYVYNKSDSHKEREFAWLTHAKFWRNGSVFKTARDNFYENNKSSVLGTRNTITTVKNQEDLERLLRKYNFYSNEEDCTGKN